MYSHYITQYNLNDIFQIPEVHELGTEFSLQILQMNADQGSQKLNRSGGWDGGQDNMILIAVDT